MTTKIARPLIAARFLRCSQTMGLRNYFWTLLLWYPFTLFRPPLNSWLFNRERHSLCLLAPAFTAIIILKSLTRMKKINFHVHATVAHNYSSKTEFFVWKKMLIISLDNLKIPTSNLD